MATKLILILAACAIAQAQDHNFRGWLLYLLRSLGGPYYFTASDAVYLSGQVWEQNHTLQVAFYSTLPFGD